MDVRYMMAEYINLNVVTLGTWEIRTLIGCSPVQLVTMNLSPNSQNIWLCGRWVRVWGVRVVCQLLLSWTTGHTDCTVTIGQSTPTQYSAAMIWQIINPHYFFFSHSRGGFIEEIPVVKQSLKDRGITARKAAAYCPQSCTIQRGMPVFGIELSLLGEQTYVRKNLPSVIRKLQTHTRNVCNFLPNDTMWRSKAHCRAVSCYLSEHCPRIITHRCIHTAQKRCVMCSVTKVTEYWLCVWLCSFCIQAVWIHLLKRAVTGSYTLSSMLSIVPGQKFRCAPHSNRWHRKTNCCQSHPDHYQTGHRGSGWFRATLCWTNFWNWGGSARSLFAFSTRGYWSHPASRWQ